LIQQAEWVAGLQLAENDRKSLANSLNQAMRDYETLRKVPLPNHVPLDPRFPAGPVAAGRPPSTPAAPSKQRPRPLQKARVRRRPRLPAGHRAGGAGPAAAGVVGSN